MFVKILQLLRGYVIFIAKGGFGERFINLCTFRRIDIWDVSCCENSIRAKIAIKNFSKLRSVARKTGVKIKITHKRGMPFYLKAHNDRVGLIIGIIFFVLFSVIMNRFVWCISATDSENFSSEQIIEVAESVGLRYGVYVSTFDEEKAAREIYKAFDGELSYVKVNIKGSLAVIEYRDSKKKLEIEEEGEPSNIIADFDGVIVSDETYKGVRNISKGNAVKEGDVLISGVVEGVDSKPLYYEAKGNFTALHNSSSKSVIDSIDKVESFSEAKEYYKLILFGIEFPLGFIPYKPGNVKVYSYRSFLKYNGYVIPFGIEKKTIAFYEEESIDKAIAEKLVCMNYSSLVYDKYKNSNIVYSDVKIIEERNRLTVSGKYSCIDFIGKSKPIIIENSEN